VNGKFRAAEGLNGRYADHRARLQRPAAVSNGGYVGGVMAERFEQHFKTGSGSRSLRAGSDRTPLEVSRADARCCQPAEPCGGRAPAPSIT
jgi:hypothetical protein